MEEQIKELDSSLIIYSRKDYKDEIHVYCGRQYENKKIHQTIIRKVLDIPFNGKKVIIFLTVRRFKNDFDLKSNKKTITETFDFLNETKRRTKRLDENLYDLTKNQSFKAAAEYSKKYIANVSDDTLINMIVKKTKQ